MSKPHSAILPHQCLAISTFHRVRKAQPSSSQFSVTVRGIRMACHIATPSSCCPSSAPWLPETQCQFSLKPTPILPLKLYGMETMTGTSKLPFSRSFLPSAIASSLWSLFFAYFRPSLFPTSLPPALSYFPPSLPPSFPACLFVLMPVPTRSLAPPSSSCAPLSCPVKKKQI